MEYHDTDSLAIDRNTAKQYLNSLYGATAICTTTFSLALEAIKQGKKAKRIGWNGKDQYIDIGYAFSYKDNKGNIINPNHENIGSSAIIFHGTSGEQVGWLASQADMLANDWLIID